METTTPSPVLLKASQVRALLQIGRSTYYDLIATGQLRAVKLGRNVFVPRDAVDDFIRNLPPASKVDRD